MADFTNVQKRSSQGWIIGGVVVVLVLLLAVFTRGTDPTISDPTAAQSEAVPATEPAAVATPAPAPAPDSAPAASE